MDVQAFSDPPVATVVVLGIRYHGDFVLGISLTNFYWQDRSHKVGW